jgi:hypothetical protein
MSRSTFKKTEVCGICHLPRQQCPGHRPKPIEWCPPAAAEGALTHADWARLGWRLVESPRGSRRSGHWRS